MTVTFTKEVTIKTASDDYKDPRIEGIKVLVVVVSTDFIPTTPGAADIEDLAEAIRGYAVLLQNTYGEENVRVVGAGYDADAGKTLRRKDLRTGDYKYDYSKRTILTVDEVLGLLNFEKGEGEKYDQIHFCGHGGPYDSEKNIPGGTLFEIDTGQSGFPEPGSHWWQRVVSEDMQSEDESLARESWPIKEENEPVKGFTTVVKIVLAACFSCTGSMKALFEKAVGKGNVHCCKGRIEFGVPEKDAKENIIMKDWYEYDQTIQDIARFLGIPKD